MYIDDSTIYYLVKSWENFEYRKVGNHAWSLGTTDTNYTKSIKIDP